MNIMSRAITGIVIIVLGLGLGILSFFGKFFILFYAIPIFVIGVIIFFNKKEDEIERIKQ